jgi:hypothetical protein
MTSRVGVRRANWLILLFKARPLTTNNLPARVHLNSQGANRPVGAICRLFKRDTEFASKFPTVPEFSRPAIGFEQGKRYSYFSIRTDRPYPGGIVGLHVTVFF